MTWRRLGIGAIALALLGTLPAPARADTTQYAGVQGGDAIHLLADPAHGYEFLAAGYAGNPGDSTYNLQAFDPSGTSVERYAFGPTGGLAIIGDTLYATTPYFNWSIRRFDLTADPPSETTPLEEDRALHGLVAAGGLLWAAECLDGSVVESVNPTTGAEVPQDLSGLDINRCPEFADDPAHSKIFYVWSRYHATLYRMDTTGGTLAATASWEGSQINDVAVAPDGSAVVVGTATGAVVLDPTSLVATGVTYRAGSNIQAVSISGDGHVAVGVWNEVKVFPAGSGTPSASWALGGCVAGVVNVRGLSFGPTDTNLFASSQYGQAVTVLTHATSALSQSTISLGTAPAAPTPGDTITLAGTLQIPGGAVSGRAVHLYEGGGALGTVTTDASGGFSFDVPDVAAGSHCYDARFAGSAAATGAVSRANGVVEKVPSAVSIAGPTTTPLPGDQVELTGSLAFDDAASTEGAVVHVERAPAGAVFDWEFTTVGDATVQADGTWTIADVAGDVGAYSYRATFDETDRYLGSTARVDVDVHLHSARIRVETSSSRVVYGKKITLTARVQLADEGTRPKIAFFMDLPSKPPTVLAKVRANSEGVARYTLSPPGGGAYGAAFNGDARNKPATDQTGVKVAWGIYTRLKRNYGKSGQYRLFHQGVTPLYLIALNPALRYDVNIALQRLDGSWRTVARGGWDTSHDGVLAVVIDPRILKIGNRYRLVSSVPDATIRGGYRLIPNESPYSYFRITS